LLIKGKEVKILGDLSWDDMKKVPIEELVKEKVGFHRGLVSEEHSENSLGAVREAVNLGPFCVEFDVTLVNGEVWTKHPPQEPLDRLEEVLPLFEGKETYPKIDIKLMGEPPSPAIDAVLSLVEQTRIKFVLINLGLGLGRRTKKAIGNYRDYFMGAENYLATRAGDNPKIRLNNDLERYRPAREKIDNGIESHVAGLGTFVYSISPEIHDEDGEMVAQFAKRHKTGQLVFWLREPKVTEETIRAALALEEKYDLEVYFDINPQFIVGFDIVKLSQK